MSYQVMEFLDENPNAGIRDIITHFSEALQINEQIEFLKSEVERVLELRIQLRPLYAQKMDLESDLQMLSSDMDLKVMMKYPPRKGSDKERKAYKLELRQENEEYVKKQNEVEDIKSEIESLEEEMAAVQQRAKNARRLVDLFNTYMGVLVNGGLSHILKEQAGQNQESSNSNIF